MNFGQILNFLKGVTSLFLHEIGKNKIF